MMNNDDICVIIGASSQDYPGWIRIQEEELDLTRGSDWEARFRPGSISRVLAEHVWEHLDPAEGSVAANICFDFLRPGGFVRCAVPDGLFPDEAYQRIVQVGGPGAVHHPAAGHKVVYDYCSLPALFGAARFEVMLLEWWDVEGEFHARSGTNERDSSIGRRALTTVIGTAATGSPR